MTRRHAPRRAIRMLAALAVALSCALYDITAQAASAAPTKPRPVPLFNDLGKHHREVTTASPLAQRYFDQGLTLLYGFNHDEAERSFREAARLDPDCGMAWWGVALALGPNINLPIDPDRNRAAVQAIEAAQAREGRATETEADLIEALARRYSADPEAGRASLDRAYARAMRRVHRRHPDDLDAATLYAESLMDLRPWQLWDADGEPAEDTEEILALLESVMERDPMHPGANHYYIHAVEASPHPERALASAKKLESLVPGAGHLIHMPAHIYMRTGDYAGAARSNARAATVDRAYIKAHDVKGVYPLMYYSHNLHFEAIAAAMAGQSAAASRAASRLAAEIAPIVHEMPMAEFVLPTSLYVDLRFQRWGAILKAPEPDRVLATTHALWHFARGAAFNALGRKADTRRERAALEAERAAIGADVAWNLNRAADVLAIAADVLDARLAAAAGDREAAVDAWSRAAAAQDRLAYDEPPAWYYPVRESLGGELLRSGKPADAEAVLRADLARNPRNGRSLFGLWKSLAAQKKLPEAAAARREFEAAWKTADVPLRVADL